MSRRDSRASIDVRQNDVLFEFENFKKKFLLANKQITKLNSNLSIRIEELNAEKSTLYAENLRLRASEIALAAQLRKERQKSRQLLTEVETAVAGLSKHFGLLRVTFDIPSSDTPSPTPSPPRAAQRPLPNSSPPLGRLSRPPNVPGIYEEDEPAASSGASDDEENIRRAPSPVTSPRQKVKGKGRLSASRLPLPSRASPPPDSARIQPSLHIDFTVASVTGPRKPARRQSGMIALPKGDDAFVVVRSDTPAAGPRLRDIVDDTELSEAAPDEIEAQALEAAEILRKERKKAAKREREREKEREQARAAKALSAQKTSVPDALAKKVKTKDLPKVHRPALASLGNTIRDAPAQDGHDDIITTAPRTFLATSKSESQSPPPSLSSSHEPTPEPDDPSGAVRTRRVRTSVNYAEPKLNTKMRKPDPPEDVPGPRKRMSAAAVLNTTNFKKRNSLEDSGPGTEPESDQIPYGTRTSFEPANVPLPSSRPTSTTNVNSSPSPTSSPGSKTIPAKRKKPRSRPNVISDDDVDEDDGAYADEEYIPAKAKASWASADSGRSTGQGRRLALGADFDREERRHSMVV